ncbi:MAG TPA: hypothetical protein VHI52_16280 [Verrucomicrobiae bacterium]|nr:hypothetical protein [Verrucomicrobiae bacterium]
MKPDGPLKHFVIAFLIAAACYAVFYPTIEHRRVRKGPWEVAFTNSSEGAPMVVINQPKLAITNVQLSFPDHPALPTPAQTNFAFKQPREVPYTVPLGECVFMDTTFLPGTVTFKLAGHEVELLPRVLIVDHQEYPWVSGSTLTLHRH